MSLLRQLCDEKAFRADPFAELLEKAILIRRAGLEHLVTVATGLEVVAMAAAGRKLAAEELAEFAAAIQRPSVALAAIDGGAALARETLDAVKAHVRSGGV